MKRLIMLFVVLATMCGTASAQGNLLDALKGAATGLVDEVTGGKATQMMLPGSWSYSSPALRLVSDNMLSNVASSAVTQGIESKLSTVYQGVGIKPGSCSYTFNNDGSFTAVISKHNLSGTYTYDATSHVIELKYSTKLLNLGTMKGYAYIDGAALELVFDCSKILNFVTKLGSKSTQLSTITSLVGNYDGMMIGFGFNKK